MPDRDRMVVFLTDGTSQEYGFRKPCSPIQGKVVRIDLIRKDQDLRLTFPLDPTDSRSSFVCSHPTSVLFGKPQPLTASAKLSVAWLFSKAKTYLYAKLNVETGLFSYLGLGPIDSLGGREPEPFLSFWNEGKLDSAEGLLIKNSDEDFTSDLLSKIGKISLEEAEPKSLRGTRFFFKPVRDKDCKPSSTKQWVPVLESMVKLAADDDDLQLWGTRAKIKENRTVRLLQVPKHLVCGEAEPDPAKEREWYVAIQGLPHSWGEVLWNDLLSEQIRVSELDVQHGSLFTPLFPRAGSLPNLSWNVAYSVRENPKEAKVSEIKALSLRLGSKTADGKARVQFPLIRNHLGQPIEAAIPLPVTALFDDRLAKLEEFNAGFEQTLDAILHPGIGWSGEVGSTASLFQNLPPTEAEKDPRRGRVRIGAFDVTFSPASLQNKQSQQLEFLWRLSPDSDRQLNPLGRYRWEESLVAFDWSVDRVTPGGQDDLTGDLFVDCDEASLDRLSKVEREERKNIDCKLQRERPLVISLSAEESPKKLLLNVKEEARQRDTRRIDLIIRRPSSEGVSPKSSGDLKDLCSDDAKGLDRVAVLDREPFLIAKVSFPALGSLKDPAASDEIAIWRSYGHEAGAWHIRFPDAQNFCTTLPPQGVGETMEKAKTLGEGELADFRLSPPALLSMRETYYQQNFPEAPWNLRRLLSDPGRELPGAQLTQLQYELLYGLSCRINYPFMRLAEVSALVGDVMGPLPRKPRWSPRAVIDGVDQQDPKMVALYDVARRNWADTYQRTRRRLGIFELWDIRRLDTLELKENVTCWIRQTPTGEMPNDKELPSQLVPVPRAELANPFDTTSQGLLKGGVTWGFESRNVYQAVLRPSFENTEKKWPRSGGAEMRDTRFSALGGYGHQMSAFDNWRTKILADVSMGRTYSYTLERIGRIGVWWNRAKHVIIYERTVVPSAQFDADQNPLAGRAVLRKVEEYVEILQNTRKFPDSEQGNPKSTGFVAECSFSDDPNQIIRFRVKSSWGADIGKIGWKVPIWRPGEKPDFLYPKPVVNLTVLASVEGKSEPRKVTIADPDNLYFYTDTTVTPEAANDPSVDLSDTDKWSPVEGVDFVDESRPRPQPDKGFQTGSLRQSSPGDSALPMGFRPCTFLIEPAEHTVDLLANRKGDPMGAALSSVTLCRANLSETSSSLGSVVESARSVIAEEIRKSLDLLPAEASQFKPEDLSRSLDKFCTDAGEAFGKKFEGVAAQLEEGNKKIQGLGDNIQAVIEKLDQQATATIAVESKRIAAFPKRLVEELKDKKAELKKALNEEMTRFKARADLLPSPAAYLVSVESILYETEQRLIEVQGDLKKLAEGSLDAWIAKARLPELIERLRSLQSSLRQFSQRLRGFAATSTVLESDSRNLSLGLGPLTVVKKIDFKAVADLLERVERALASAERFANGIESQAALAKDRLKAVLDNAGALAKPIKKARELLAMVRKQIEIAEAERRTFLATLLDRAEKAATDYIDGLGQNQMVELSALQVLWEDEVKTAADTLVSNLNVKLKEVRESSKELFKDLSFDHLIPKPKAVGEAVTGQCDALKKQVSSLLTELGDRLGVEEKIAEIRRGLERYRDEAIRKVEEELGGGIKLARQVLGTVEAKQNDVLNLVRAFGKPPDVSGLQFDRPEVAFFYNEIKDHVDVTPVIARAAQAGAVLEALKPFGVDLPVQELGEQLIPASLKNFDLSSILPNISGIPLQNLFSGVKMPDLSSEHVKVTHGVDVQTRRAWVNTDVNFVIPGDTKLFALGPLAVSIVEPHFKAEARMEVDLKGIQKQRVNGRLGGDWKLRIGGFELITFTQTPLEFDDSGRVRFEVDPSNVKLAEALKFINELLSTMSPGGLSIRFDGDGVVCSLDLPLPDTQLGAFGFSGLTLATSLALRYSGGDFSIGVTAGLARRDAPFTLTIFILGGGGYLELGSRYHPSTGKIAATADMAIAVSASLAIALGPIRGGVAVYVGVTANYDSLRGGGLAVGLMFMIRGHVSILSIASATITLRLDGLYQGGVLIGRGQFEIRIKICWCFTLEVSESVTYTLGRVGSGSGWLGGPQPVAQLASLGLPADFAGGGADSSRVTKLDSKSLVMGVDAYLNMLA